ncbi:unnamed protein product, partial [Effrenium voratum]
MSAPRGRTDRADYARADYAPVEGPVELGESEVAGECRRLLGCNLAIAMLCVLFMICCLVVTVILDPASAVKAHPAHS